MRQPTRVRHAASSPAFRLLHYWWPVVMAASLAAVVARATGRTPDSVGLSILFTGVVAAYSLDRVLDRHERQDPFWMRRLLVCTGILASATGAVLLVKMPVRAALVAPLLGAVVLAYPRLKHVIGLKTALVAGAWTWAAVALPFPDGSWAGWRAWTLPVAWPLTLLVAAGSLLCDLKDTERDRALAVASLPATLGRSSSAAIAFGLSAAGLVLSLVQARYGLMVTGAGLAALCLCPNWLARDSTGALVVDMTLSLPGLLIALHLV